MADYPLDLLSFFKALADAERLQIAGLLARRSLTGAQLAEAVGLKPAALARHMARLVEAGLVGEVNGRYRLRLDKIHALAARVSTHTAPSVPETATEFEAAVLRAFLTPEGALKEIPAQEKKMLVILRHLRDQFEPGREYPEKQVNEIIQRFHPDTASLRRMLIDYGLMRRGNGIYWRAGEDGK